MAVATLMPVRALRRPRRTDPRALIGVCLTLAALAGSVVFWIGANDARAVLVATRDLPAGATLHATDVGVAYLRMDEDLYRAAVPSDALNSLVGRQLGEPIHSQQVLARAQLADQTTLSADQVAITIPARPDSAVDGRLRPGDAVRVLVTTTDKTSGQAHSRQVVERATVFEVGRDASAESAGVLSGADETRAPITSLTVAVSPDDARQLAEARRSGELDVLLLPSTAPNDH
jgi:pilus assembly protein CpaB